MTTSFIQYAALVFEPLHLKKDLLGLQINGTKMVRRLLASIKRHCCKEATPVLVDEIVWIPEDR